VRWRKQPEELRPAGCNQVRRFKTGTVFIGAGIWYWEGGPRGNFTIIDPLDPTRRKRVPADAAHEDLLVPIFRGGRLVYRLPALAEIRERTQTQLAGFHTGIKSFGNPHQNPVGLEAGLTAPPTRLILEARGESRKNSAGTGLGPTAALLALMGALMLTTPAARTAEPGPAANATSASSAPSTGSRTVHIRIDATRSVGELRPFWRFFGCD